MWHSILFSQNIYKNSTGSFESKCLKINIKFLQCFTAIKIICICHLSVANKCIIVLSVQQVLGSWCMAPETKVTQMLAVCRGVVQCKQQNKGNKTDATEV